MWNDPPWLKMLDPGLWRRHQEDNDREQSEQRDREQRDREQRDREQRDREQRDREQRDREQSEQRDREQRDREQRDREQRDREQRDRKASDDAAAARKAADDAAAAKKAADDAAAARKAADDAAAAKKAADDAAAKLARDNAPCTYGDYSTVSWNNDCDANINNCKLGGTSVSGIETGKSAPLTYKCGGYSTIEQAYSTNTRTCEKKCPCQYNNNMIPKEGATCSRACGGGLIDSIYQLVNGPSTCPEKNGKKDCNTNKCPDPCLASGTCSKPEGFTGFSLNGVSSAITALNIPETDKVMKYEANLLEALYLFNNEYTYYVSNCTGKENGFVPDTVNNPRADCKSYYDNLITDRDKIIDYTSTANAITGKKLGTSVDYKNQNATLMTTYSNLINMRADLDEKLKELYDVPGSKSLDYRYNLDSTIYSGILVTIVATAVIYFTFTRL